MDVILTASLHKLSEVDRHRMFALGNQHIRNERLVILFLIFLRLHHFRYISSHHRQRIDKEPPQRSPVGRIHPDQSLVLREDDLGCLDPR